MDTRVLRSRILLNQATSIAAAGHDSTNNAAAIKGSRGAAMGGSRGRPSGVKKSARLARGPTTQQQVREAERPPAHGIGGIEDSQFPMICWRTQDIEEEDELLKEILAATANKSALPIPVLPDAEPRKAGPPSAGKRTRSSTKDVPPSPPPIATPDCVRPPALPNSEVPKTIPDSQCAAKPMHIDPEESGSSHEEGDLFDQEISDEELPDPDGADGKSDGGSDHYPLEDFPAHMQPKRKERAKLDVHSRTASGKGEPRAVIEEKEVLVLVKHYKLHMKDFITYRKGKKLKQLIPAKVWEKVEAAYKVAFPASTFQKDALKEHLRRAIVDIDDSQQNAIPPEDAPDAQDEDVLAQIMASQAAKERNVMRTRMGLCQQTSSGSGKKSAQPSTPQTAQVTEPSLNLNEAPKRPLTKSQHLRVAGDNMSDLLSEVRGLKGELVKPPPAAEHRRKLDEEKVEILRSKRRGQETHNILAEIALLKEQKSLGLIGDLEFMDLCRAKFSSRSE